MKKNGIISLGEALIDFIPLDESHKKPRWCSTAYSWKNKDMDEKQG